MLKNLLIKKFSNEDQFRFSELSGDYNPIHISNKLARTSIAGEVIVHGINILLTGLESLEENNLFLSNDYVAYFYKPLKLNKKVFFNYDKNKSLLEIIEGEELISKIFIGRKMDKFPYSKVTGLVNKNNFKKPNYCSKNEIEKINIKAYYSGAIKFAEILYPRISKKIGVGTISQIATLSEIVGMQFPGLNSLFTKCDIDLSTKYKNPKVKIKSFNKTIGAVKIRCEFKNLSANINALFRPRPIKTPKSIFIKENYKIVNLKNLKPIIIGGSRGIGAWMAKFIVIGGGNVNFTYCYGEDEANELIKDMADYQQNIKTVQFDVLGNINKKQMNYFKDRNSLFYFATPKIIPNSNKNFDNEIYEKFNEYYINSFIRLISNPILKNIKYIFYPSTIFIDKKENNLREYIASKSQAEKICREIAEENGKIFYIPRLPKMLTDQTNSFTNDLYKDIGETIMPILNDIHNDIHY